MLIMDTLRSPPPTGVSLSYHRGRGHVDNTIAFLLIVIYTLLYKPNPHLFTTPMCKPMFEFCRQVGGHSITMIVYQQTSKTV